MNVVFHNADDCAPFPHRVWSSRTGSVSKVICATCDHMAERIVPGCTCRQNCHPEMTEYSHDDDDGVDWEDIQTSQKGTS